MDTQKLWLDSFPWEQVRTINQSLCHNQNTAFEINGSYNAARDLWQQAATKPSSLHDVLDLCRRCFEMAPFTFNNGNTFATIGKTLVDDWIKTLPAVEGQILRNTVGHYVAGLIGKKELIKVLQHFQTSWNTYAAARQRLPTPISLNVPQSQQAQSS